MAWFLLNDEQTKAILEITNSTSDRILTVVGGALLDQSLDLALKFRMRQDKKVLTQLFKDTGPLSGANKVHLGYLLYMFDEPMRDAMEAIYAIRNLFAHKLDMSFGFSDDQRMKDALAKLVLHEGKKFYQHPFLNGDSEEPMDPVTDDRSRYVVNLKIALLWLGADSTKHLSYTNQPI
jgi:hypothetical protein